MRFIVDFSAPLWLMMAFTGSNGFPVHDTAAVRALVSHSDGQTYYNGTLVAKVYEMFEFE